MTSINYQHAVDLLEAALYNPQELLCIKVMCALLKYNVRMSLEGLIRTKLKAVSPLPLEINYDGTRFTIAGTIMTVPENFNAYLRTLETERLYLVTDPQGKPYLQHKKLNTACVLLFGQDYRTMQHVFRNPPAVVKVFPSPPAPPKLKLKVKLNSTSSKLSTLVNPKIKPDPKAFMDGL